MTATRVVIAEDECLTAMLLQAELEHQGFEVVGLAHTGKRALEVCLEKSPDVVLMDIQMPEGNGLEATRLLMEASPTCVVIVTAQGDAEGVAEQAGAMGYVQKPLPAGQIPLLIAAARHRFQEFVELRTDATALADVMPNWLTVCQAVRALVQQQRLSEDAAFAWLHHDALTKRATLAAAAGAVLAGLAPKPQQAAVG